MGSFSQVRHAARPRDRLARYLAAHCRSPKELAREIAVTPKAAENILAGHWPGELTMAAIVRRFGQGVWNAVFLPEAEPELAALIEREGKLREELARMQARRLEMGAGRALVPDRRSRVEDPA